MTLIKPSPSYEESWSDKEKKAINGAQWRLTPREMLPALASHQTLKLLQTEIKLLKLASLGKDTIKKTEEAQPGVTRKLLALVLLCYGELSPAEFREEKEELRHLLTLFPEHNAWLIKNDTELVTHAWKLKEKKDSKEKDIETESLINLLFCLLISLTRETGETRGRKQGWTEKNEQQVVTTARLVTQVLRNWQDESVSDILQRPEENRARDIKTLIKFIIPQGSVEEQVKRLLELIPHLEKKCLIDLEKGDIDLEVAKKISNPVGKALQEQHPSLKLTTRLPTAEELAVKNDYEASAEIIRHAPGRKESYRLISEAGVKRQENKVAWIKNCMMEVRLYQGEENTKELTEVLPEIFKEAVNLEGEAKRNYCLLIYWDIHETIEKIEKKPDKFKNISKDTIIRLERIQTEIARSYPKVRMTERTLYLAGHLDGKQKIVNDEEFKEIFRKYEEKKEQTESLETFLIAKSR